MEQRFNQHLVAGKMNDILLILCLLFFLPNLAFTQVLKDGYYVSKEGAATGIIKVISDTKIKGGEHIFVKESDGIFRRKYKVAHTSSGEIFQDLDENESKMIMQVISVNNYALFWEGRKGRTDFFWKSKEIPQLDLDSDCMELSTKYYELGAEKSGIDGMSFLSCATIASQKCMNPDKEFLESFMKISVERMKELDKSTKCPCPDVIPQEIWDKY